MSAKTLAWILLCAMGIGAVLLFNYWASFQLLSTLVYAGIVAALFGLANLALPFRFLGVRKRAVGALVLAGGVALTLAALFWPAALVRVAQPSTRLDDIMPEYQFFEKHSARIHARPEQVMRAVRQSTFGDMRSLAALLKIRAAVLRIHDTGELPKDKRVLDAFAAPGVVLGDSEREIVVCWIADTRAKRLAEVRTLGEFAGCREPAWINQLRSSPLFRRRGARRSSTGRPWLRSPALAQPPRPSRRGVGEAERPHPVVASAGPGRRRVDAVARRAASALARRAREEPAAARAFAGAQRQALAAWEEWSEVVALEPVRLQAERIVTAQPLRAADALQLGAALVAADLDASAFEFVTLDERLATAAEREGFRVLGA